MIVSFRHKGLEELYNNSKSKKIDCNHWKKIKQQLDFLDLMEDENQILEMVAWCPHHLSGKNNSGQDVDGHWSLKVSGNWRITYSFTENGEVILLDYIDYH